MIYDEAMRVFGVPTQITVCVEELSELQKELCKHLRGSGDIEHIAEEIADVLITTGQMIRYFDCEEDVLRWQCIKLQRLAERIKEARQQ